MIKREKDGIHYLQFELFEEFSKLKHAIFLREGGFSKAPYDSLNLSYTVGDDEKSVKKNEEKILSILAISKVVRGNLVHGKKVMDVADLGLGEPSDGIATKTPNLGLLSTHADCQAAQFYDPVHHAIANVHCGWRGNVQNIYEETVSFMKEAYETNPKDLYVGISPSLGPLEAEFINYKKELLSSFWSFETSKNHFDFWEIARMQLLEAGILEGHMQIARIDTFRERQDYFSYRRDGLTGRNASVIALI